MSIDLIYPGRDTAALVKDLDDVWIVSGPIRACIHLANVWHLKEPGALTKIKDTGGKGAVHYRLNEVNIFGPNELDHPMTQWAALNASNYAGLMFYAEDMCEEYKRRFPHVTKHGISAMLSALETMPECVPEEEWTPPAFATNVEFVS